MQYQREGMGTHTYNMKLADATENNTIYGRGERVPEIVRKAFIFIFVSEINLFVRG